MEMTLNLEDKEEQVKSDQTDMAANRITISLLIQECLLMIPYW